jgi:hypothetical protein
LPFSRDDRYISDAQGRAISGASIWYCSQPAVTTSLPPTPLATVYDDNEADEVLSQPILTDGDGHAFAYMDATQLYTVVISHPLLGPNPLVLPDQTVGGGSGGVGLRPVEETPIGTIDGNNTIFTLTYPVSQPTIWNNYSLIPGLGYTLSGAGNQTITFANAPRPGVDNIFATYWTAAGLSPTVNISPPSVTLNATGVGSGASFSLATGSTAFAGTITLNTGTSPFGGQVLLWTFVSSPAPVNRTIVTLFPVNPAAQQATVYMGASNAGGCQIDTRTGLTASTQYIWNYILVQI